MTAKRKVDPDASYGKWMERAEQLLNETNQYLIGVCYWNNQIRPDKYPDQPPIELDPKGEIEHLRQHLYKVLGLTCYYVDCSEPRECGYSGEGVIDHPCPQCGRPLEAAQREPV